MDFSSFNFSTLFMIIIAISIAYAGIRFFSSIFLRVGSIALGCVLLIWALNLLGISIPVISNVIMYLVDFIKMGIENLMELIQSLNG